jgi:hypothetical protein
MQQQAAADGRFLFPSLLRNLCPLLQESLSCDRVEYASMLTLVPGDFRNMCRWVVGAFVLLLATLTLFLL